MWISVLPFVRVIGTLEKFFNLSELQFRIYKRGNSEHLPQKDVVRNTGDKLGRASSQGLTQSKCSANE